MNENELVKITFAFKLPREVADKARNIHEKLAEKYEVAFPEKGYNPHVTLYQAVFPVRNKEKVISALESVVSRCEPTTFTPKGINIRNQYVGIGFERATDLMNLHETLVDKLNHLREGAIKPRYLKIMSTLPKEEREHIDKWGYTHVHDLYKPHVTLITLADPSRAEQAASEVEWDEGFTCDTIMVVIKQGEEKETKEFSLIKN